MPPDVAAPESAASKGWMGLAECDHLLDEAEMIRMGYLTRPVQPCRIVVLVIWIIVAALGLQKLVARGQHRDAVGQQQQADQVLRLPLAKGHHIGGHSLVSLPAAVPAIVLR